MPLELRPLSNRVVIVPDTAEEQSAGGIYIPSTGQEKPQTGTVIAVGPGKVSEFPVVASYELKYDIGDEEGPSEWTGNLVQSLPEFPRQPMDLEAGMRVVFGKYAGSEVEIDRETYIVCRETDVMSIIYEEEEE